MAHVVVDLLKMLIFHSYVTVYQRVPGHNQLSHQSGLYRRGQPLFSRHAQTQCPFSEQGAFVRAVLMWGWFIDGIDGLPVVPVCPLAPGHPVPAPNSSTFVASRWAGSCKLVDPICTLHLHGA